MSSFSSLLEHKSNYHDSHPFRYKGFNWKLRVYPKNTEKKSRKACIGLTLVLDNASSLPSSFVIATDLRLRVCDQLFNKHCERQVQGRFSNGTFNWGFKEMLSLKTFKGTYYGYLLKDNCNFEVKFLKFHARNVDCNRMFERLSVQKKPTSDSYTLKIERLSNRHEPRVCSDIFDIGGYTWKLDVHHDGAKRKKCLDVYLKLVKTSKLSDKLELYADVSLCLQDKVKLSQVKFTADKKRFSYEVPQHWEFPLVKFEDPSKEFLLENACIIEVSIVVLGSPTLH